MRSITLTFIIFFVSFTGLFGQTRITVSKAKFQGLDSLWEDKILNKELKLIDGKFKHKSNRRWYFGLNKPFYYTIGDRTLIMNYGENTNSISMVWLTKGNDEAFPAFVTSRDVERSYYTIWSVFDCYILIKQSDEEIKRNKKGWKHSAWLLFEIQSD